MTSLGLVFAKVKTLGVIIQDNLQDHDLDICGQPSPGVPFKWEQTPASGPPVDALMGTCRHCSMAAAKNSIIKELHCRHVN